MSDLDRVDPVASGCCYVVTSVNEHTPESLDDFMVLPVVALAIASERQVVTIHGSVRPHGDSITVYEKDRGGVGKDVRTWRIQQQNGRFEAVQRARY